MSLGDFPRWCVINAFFIVVFDSFRVFSKSSGEAYLPNYDFYHNLSRINEWLRHFSGQYSEFVDIELQYRSRLGLSQYVVHLTNLSHHNQNSKDTRSRLLLSFGEHAAEFFPVQSMFYLLDNITKGFDFSPRTFEGRFTRFVLNNFDLYLVTILNPDGRMLIERTKDHCWIGTVNNVDLNADFGDEESTRSMAEPECRVIRNLVSQKHFDAFISFHSGQRKIFFPLVEEKEKMPNLKHVQHLASIMSNSVMPQYSVVALKTTPSAGSIFSYAASEREIAFAYKISMWENKKKRRRNYDKDCFSAFNPLSENLQVELEAVYPLYSTLFNYLHFWKRSQLFPESQELEDTKRSRLSLGTGLFFMMASICAYFICKRSVPFSFKINYRRRGRIVSLKSLRTLFALFNFPKM